MIARHQMPLCAPGAASVSAGRSPPSQPRAAANPEPASGSTAGRSPGTKSRPGKVASPMQASTLRMRQFSCAAAKALKRLKGLFPDLPGPLPQWLLQQLLTHLTGSQQPPAAASGASVKPPLHSGKPPVRSQLQLTVQAAQAALDALQEWSSSEVAHRCGSMLADLKQSFLSGEALPADPLQAGFTGSNALQITTSIIATVCHWL